LYESFLVLAAFWISFFVDQIERALSEKVAMFVAFPAPEGNVFIINGLGPVLVMILQSNGARERLSYVQIYTDLCIRHVAPLLSGFRGLDVDVDGIVDAC
jgi:hypothetical protein